MLNKKISIILLLLFLFNIKSFSQSFLQTSSLNDSVFAVGIDNNNYLNLSYRPHNSINLVFNNSMYVETIKYQHFKFSFFYNVYKNKKISCFISAKIFGNYIDGINDNYLTPEIEWLITKRLKIASALNITHSGNFQCFEKLGLLYKINEKLDCFSEYGTPYYGYMNEKAINIGITIKQEKLYVKTHLQIPDNFSQYKYSRIFISFLYVCF